MKPTIVGATPIGVPVKPTVITPKAPVPAEMHIHPTAIPEKKETSPITVKSPTSIKGVAKESKEQKVGRLSRVLPDVRPAILERVSELFDIDNDDALTVGIPIQEKYGELVSAFTSLVENAEVSDASWYMRRILTIFQEISEAPEEKKLFSMDDTMWDLYEKSKSEIRQVHDTLKGKLPLIKEVYSKLKELHSAFATMDLNLRAATAFLLYKEKIGVYDSTEIQPQKLSLFNTVAAVENGNAVRDSAIEGVAALISKINDTVLIKVPSWIEHVTLVLRVTKTKTDAYQFKSQLTDIISKLK